MEHAHEKGDTGISPYMKLGIWDHKITEFWNMGRGII